MNDIVPLGDNIWIAISEVKDNSPLIGSTTSEPSQAKDDISAFIPPIYAIKSKGEKEILSNGSGSYKRRRYISFCYKFYL